jgi:hypothetical protein
MIVYQPYYERGFGDGRFSVGINDWHDGDGDRYDCGSNAEVIVDRRH